ncbi:MAG: hypothetical protein EoVTN8_185 [Fluviibacter phosphoraccumulans EoVTN8]
MTDLSVTPWLQITGKGDLQLTVHVQPGAKTTACAGVHGDALKIRLHAPPVDGKANQALIAWLAKTLDCPPSAIELIRGQTSRHKTLSIRTAHAEAVHRQLQTLATT